MLSETSQPAAVVSVEERHLLTRLRAHDEAAYAELLDRYHGMMTRAARLILRNDASADEIVQDSWLAVLGALPSFEGRSSLKTWLFRIVVNRARSRVVRDGRMVPFSALTTEDPDEDAVLAARFDAGGAWVTPPSLAATPEDAVLRRETAACLSAELGALPPRQRLVLHLHDIEGWSPTEICAALGMAEGNQRVLLHRARSRLRQALENHLAAA